MARFNYSGVAITSGTGRLNSGLGGTVLLKNGVVRNYVTPTNPQTALQIAVRASFNAIQIGWSQLTELERATWEAALENPLWSVTDPFTGTTRQYASAKAFFTQLNMNALVRSGGLGGSTITYQTVPAIAPIDAISNANIVAAAAADTVEVTWVGGATVNDSIVAYMTPPVSAGNSRINSVKSQLRTVSEIPAGEASPYATTYTTKYGSIVGLAGLKIGYRIDAISDLDGRRRTLAVGLSTILV